MARGAAEGPAAVGEEAMKFKAWVMEANRRFTGAPWKISMQFEDLPTALAHALMTCSPVMVDIDVGTLPAPDYWMAL